ncbi:hypothetical protein TNCV_4874191 [Trichonephila clavipes]|nr:hypothetical protein TNCV_4874191 [Trichonephila clavipes]
MTPHTIILVMGAMCEEKAGLRRSPRGLPTRKRLSSRLRLNLDSSLKTTFLPFRCSPVSSCVAPPQTEASMGGRQGQHTKSVPRSQISFSQAPSYGSRRHRGP